MSLDNVKDIDTGKEVSGNTQVPIPRDSVAGLKQEVGATKNTEVSPLVAAAIYEYLGDADSAAEYEDEFRAQFEDED